MPAPVHHIAVAPSPACIAVAGSPLAHFEPIGYRTGVPILGAHKSIAGGFHKAAQRAMACGCDCLQIFTKNANQWRARPIAADEVDRFRQALAEAHLRHPVAHDSYLINLASPDRKLWRKSIDAFVEELRRSQRLGIDYLIAHPGSYTTSSEEAGLRRVIQALDEIHRQTRDCRSRCLLETTAGQGTALGWRFEQLADILHRVQDPDRLGICFDTCHVFAAGYPLGTARQYHATMDAFDSIIGLERIKAIHLNDSQRPRGSHIDRHAHIGEGLMGLRPFRLILNDERFAHVPMYIETPKGLDPDADPDPDIRNLQTLRSLVR